MSSHNYSCLFHRLSFPVEKEDDQIIDMMKNGETYDDELLVCCFPEDVHDYNTVRYDSQTNKEYNQKKGFQIFVANSWDLLAQYGSTYVFGYKEQPYQKKYPIARMSLKTFNQELKKFLDGKEIACPTHTFHCFRNPYYKRGNFWYPTSGQEVGNGNFSADCTFHEVVKPTSKYNNLNWDESVDAKYSVDNDGLIHIVGEYWNYWTKNTRGCRTNYMRWFFA